MTLEFKCQLFHLLRGYMGVNREGGRKGKEADRGGLEGETKMGKERQRERRTWPSLLTIRDSMPLSIKVDNNSTCLTRLL